MQSNSAFLQQLYTVLRWFVTPRTLPESLLGQKRAWILSIFLFVMVWISSANFLLWALLGRVNALTMLGWGFSILGYLFSRILSYRYSSYNLIGIVSILPYFLLIFEPNTLKLQDVLFLSTLAVLFASIFTSFRVTLVASIVNFITVFMMNMVINDTMPIYGLPILMPALIVVSIILIIAYLNDENLHPSISLDAQTQIQFRNLLDTFPKPVIIHLDGKIIYANTIAERLFQESHLLDCSINDFISTENITDSQIGDSLSSLRVIYKAQLNAMTGQVYQVQVTTQAVDYKNQFATLMHFDVLETDDKVSLHQDIVSVATAMLVTDADFENGPHIHFANPAFCRLTAYEEKELIGRTPRILQGPLTEHGAIINNLKNAFERGDEQLIFETTHYRKDSTAYRAEWTTHLIYNADGKAERTISSVEDVSQRLDAQELLQTHSVQQAVVSELGLLSLSITDHLHLLEHAVVMCEQVLEMDNCAIFVYQPQDERLTCIAISHTGYGIHHNQYLSAEKESSQMAYALRVSKSVTSENLRTEVRFKTLPDVLDVGIVSALSVLIPGRTHPYGILTVFSQQAQSQIEDKLYFLQAVANILGSFAESDQAHKAEREQREFAEALRDAAAMINTRLSLAEMLDKLMGYVRQVVPQVDSGSVMLWDKAEQGYRFIYTWGYDPEAEKIVTAQSFSTSDFPLMQAMIKANSPRIVSDINKEPLWINTNDIEIIGSYLGSPITVQGECIGFFHLNSAQIMAFSQKDAQRLQTFADKVGTAIMNTRYARELEDVVKERTEELREERERIALILESSGEAIFYSENRHIAFANTSFCKLLGYRSDEVIGQLSTMFRPEDITEEEKETLEGLWARLQAGEVVREQYRLKRKDGTIIEVSITVSLVGTNSDGNTRTVAILRDISQEKAHDKLKMRFISNASHELRSPITSLKTRMYMIGREPEKANYHIDLLGQIVSRMSRLVEDLLDLGSLDPNHVVLRPESTILQDIVQSMINILQVEAELEGLILSHEMPEAPIHIWADTHRMEQVVTNLVVNAIHYTPKGGKICVCCSVDSDNNIAILRVEDTGDGIALEHIENIFEPFYRLDKNMEKKGTGLGLSITRKIVELHQGTIRVESELGKGSAFIVTLPLLEE